jgi:acetylornithine/succinyldiaminopimelate/putrescine aminotransferase
MKQLTMPGFIEKAASVGEYGLAKLREIAAKYPQLINEVRGRGLMMGLEFKEPVATVIGKLLDAGIICGPAGPNVLRFLPPLIITEADVDFVVATLDGVLGDS